MLLNSLSSFNTGYCCWRAFVICIVQNVPWQRFLCFLCFPRCLNINRELWKEGGTNIMKASLSVRPVLPYVFNDKTFKGTNWHQMKQKVHVEHITKLSLTAVLSDILLFTSSVDPLVRRPRRWICSRSHDFIMTSHVTAVRSRGTSVNRD